MVVALLQSQASYAYRIQDQFLKHLDYSFSITRCSQILDIVTQARSHIREYKLLLNLLRTRASKVHPRPNPWQSRIALEGPFDSSSIHAHQDAFKAMGDELLNLECKMIDHIMTLRDMLQRAKDQYNQISSETFVDLDSSSDDNENNAADDSSESHKTGDSTEGYERYD
ncbi:MAG: hypothetical protein LQ339_007931 [Xanthoria mediterranea]|nr:MAG: hypothetical protein LQ339_007931 [Xanthoria mediterranea]